MWFAFGILTLLGSIYVSYRARTRTKWQGSSPQLHSSSLPQFAYKEDTHKGKVIRARVGVNAPTDFFFRVRKERFYDRFFKAIGISVEMQVQDALFDKRVYLESDIEQIGTLLIQQPEMRRAILNIFLHADTKKFKRISIVCAQGRIWLEYRPPNKPKYLVDLHVIVRLLKELSDGLVRAKIPKESRRDPFVWRAIALLSVSTGTLLLGLYGVIRQASGRTDILEPTSLFWICLLPSGLAIGLFATIIIAVLGRTSRTHLVLLEGVFVGGFGFLLSTFALARDFNIDFDRGHASTYELHDVRAEHVVSQGRRRSKHHDYYLHVRDWRQPTLGQHMRLEISSGDFYRLEHVKEVVISIKPGALGFDWIESINPAW